MTDNGSSVDPSQQPLQLPIRLELTLTGPTAAEFDEFMLANDISADEAVLRLIPLGLVIERASRMGAKVVVQKRHWLIRALSRLPMARSR